MNSSDISKETKDYFKKKLGYKETWAKCVTKNNFTAGVSTTSRVESLHNVLRDYLNSNSRLSEIFQAFKNIEETHFQEFNEEFERHKKNLKNQGKLKLIEELENTYTPYVIKKVEIKVSKSIGYKVEKNRSNE